jgi:O-antigen/teichoic acid export membrane protein
MLFRIRFLVRERLTPLLYASSSVASAMVQLFASFLIIKWVAPEEVGLWQSVRMAQIYAFILLAGVNNGLSRELPFHLGKGEHAFAHRLTATAFCCVTIANTIILVCGVACAVIFARHGSQLVLAICVVTLLIMIAFYQHIFICTFRSNDSFKRLTTIQWIDAGLCIATVPLVYFFRYDGMLVRTLLTSTTLLALMYLWRPMRAGVRMDGKALKLLLKTGLPIFGLDYVKNACATLDRVVLLKLGGVRDVGIYALASTVLQSLGAFAQSLGTYLYPRMTFKYGESGDPRLLWNYGIKFVLLATVFTGIAAGAAWLILPHFVPALLPKYVEGLAAAQIVLVAGIAGAVLIIVDALWSMKIWRLMVTYQALSAILFALGPILGEQSSEQWLAAFWHWG